MNSPLRIEHPKRPRWPFLIASVLAVAVLLLFQIVPETPTSARGWVLLFLVGLPVYIALEWASGRVLNAEVGARISPARFSFARIGVALLVALFVLAPFAWWFFRQQE